MILVVGSGTSTLAFHFSLIWVFSIYVAFHDFFEFGHFLCLVSYAWREARSGFNVCAVSLLKLTFFLKMPRGKV